MNWNSFTYQARQGVRSIYQHKMMSFASIGVLTACLVLIGASLLLSLNITKLVDSVQEQNQIVVFLKDFSKDEADQKTQAMQQAIEKLPNVKQLDFVSKEDALAEQKEQLGEDSALLDGFEGDENPYPAKFVITVADQEKLPQTVASLEKLEDVEKVNSAQDVSAMLVDFRQLVQWLGTATFVLLVLVSLVIIANTIRLTVFSRRREIGIMKMVGATNGFIRTPFLVEGVLLGLIGALLSMLVLWGCYQWVAGQLDLTQFLSMSNYDGIISFDSLAVPMGACFALAGGLTGLVGSAVAVHKHLQV